MIIIELIWVDSLHSYFTKKCKWKVNVTYMITVLSYHVLGNKFC